MYFARAREDAYHGLLQVHAPWQHLANEDVEVQGAGCRVQGLGLRRQHLVIEDVEVDEPRIELPLRPHVVPL